MRSQFADQDQQTREDMRKEKRRIQDQLRRLTKQEEKATKRKQKPQKQKPLTTINVRPHPLCPHLYQITIGHYSVRFSGQCFDTNWYHRQMLPLPDVPLYTCDCVCVSPWADEVQCVWRERAHED